MRPRRRTPKSSGIPSTIDLRHHPMAKQQHLSSRPPKPDNTFIFSLAVVCFHLLHLYQLILHYCIYEGSASPTFSFVSSK
ncbi:hypothetical protein MRB53_032876 [Persea americana]|uniref:Uncharacterized protein n=1 Tax=Persea americana TaxID=3435 RepID=A0ACC2KT75_PERAE|nr:hypothetical protein MRB53_032876 [Persea americana]